MDLTAPLAERMRPHKLDDYIAQEHIIGKNAPLRKMIASGFIPSLIFWGAPGTGKTTLAFLLAEELQRPFYSLSAISSGVKDVREVIEKAGKSGGLFAEKPPMLFIDEIHRFSKAQQDSLLGAVEKGRITLIGATTENPSFEVIPALLSRSQVYVLEQHNKEDLIKILKRAAKQDELLSTKKITFKEYDALLRYSGGDARKLLNLLELLVLSEQSDKITITNKFVGEKIQQNPARYDKAGEMHYDIISAFIKSVRGSDPDAAIYYLARMISAGEDLKFIARRLLILASEDIGMANPNALLLAQTCFAAVSEIGYPESRIILSQCTIYLATSPKSNASYMAIGQALAFVEKTGDLPIPLHLRNAPTKLMKDLNYGKEYLYPHDFENNFIPQQYLPEEALGEQFYKPKKNATFTKTITSKDK